MEGVMTQDEVNKILMKSRALFAHNQTAVEPDNEQGRAEQRLVRYGYQRLDTTTEDNCAGNCLLKAVSLHVYGNDQDQQRVRRAGLASLRLHRPYYESLRRYYHLNNSWAMLSCPNNDVDELFALAIADAYRVRIISLISDEKYCIVEYIPSNREITKTISIVTSEGHTDAMYPL